MKTLRTRIRRTRGYCEPDGGRGRSDRPRLADGDHPEDPVVLEPCGALDQRPQVELVRAARSGSRDCELEPGDLTRTDIVGGLHRDPVVSRPARVWRAELPVTAERSRAILSRVGTPCTEVRDLAHASAHPADRA